MSIKHTLLITAILLTSTQAYANEKEDGAASFLAHKRWERMVPELYPIGIHFDTLEEVNGFVNGFRYKRDTDLGTWDLPQVFIKRGYGDCEEFAVTKLALLIENDLVSPDDAYFLVVRDTRRDGALHIVLVANGMVLDNQYKDAYPVSSKRMLRYVRITKIEVGE